MTPESRDAGFQTPRGAVCHELLKEEHRFQICSCYAKGNFPFHPLLTPSCPSCATQKGAIYYSWWRLIAHQKKVKRSGHFSRCERGRRRNAARLRGVPGLPAVNVNSLFPPKNCHAGSFSSFRVALNYPGERRREDEEKLFGCDRRANDASRSGNEEGKGFFSPSLQHKLYGFAPADFSFTLMIESQIKFGQYTNPCTSTIYNVCQEYM